MEKQNTLGARIKYHRKRLGLTQEQLAEHMHVSPQAVSKWENNLSCPDIATLPQLAALFGLSVDELLDHRTQPTVQTQAQPAGADHFHFEWGKPNSTRYCTIVFGIFALLFGGLTLLIPSHFTVVVNEQESFAAAVTVKGAPSESSCGTLQIRSAQVHFGEICIRYLP